MFRIPQQSFSKILSAKNFRDYLRIPEGETNSISKKIDKDKYNTKNHTPHKSHRQITKNQYNQTKKTAKINNKTPQTIAILLI